MLKTITLLPAAGVLGLALLAAPIASAQEGHKLSARELFYVPVASPAKPKPPALRPPRPANPPKAESPAPKPSGAQSPARIESGELRHAVDTKEVFPPLGLRYSLLRLKEGEYVEVDADTEFVSGDKLRLSFESNTEAYLYIVMRGSSGTWKLLFPAREINGGENRIAAGKRLEIPSIGRFAFDDQPGSERLFLLLTRQPENDFESMIYSLQGGDAKPASTPGDRPKEHLLLASGDMRPIGDDFVSRMRGRISARDLVFEKVDDGSASADARKEKAVYVVNPSRDADARLVADLQLKHR